MRKHRTSYLARLTRFFHLKRVKRARCAWCKNTVGLVLMDEFETEKSSGPFICSDDIKCRERYWSDT